MTRTLQVWGRAQAEHSLTQSQPEGGAPSYAEYCFIFPKLTVLKHLNFLGKLVNFHLEKCFKIKNVRISLFIKVNEIINYLLVLDYLICFNTVLQCK